MHNFYNGAHCSQLTDRSITAYASSSFIIQEPMSQTNTNIYPHKITRAHTHYPVHVTAALNTSQLTDLHLQLTLTKFDMPSGPLFALHFKNRPRKASVTHPPHRHKHTQTLTRAHTSQRLRHSCPDHIPPNGPAFTIHTDKVRFTSTYWCPIITRMRKVPLQFGLRSFKGRRTGVSPSNIFIPSAEPPRGRAC